MPHQCLKCGTLFPDGSTIILRGCPECRGTRFFYTAEALAAEEREKLLHQGEADVRTILEGMMSGAMPEGVAKMMPAIDPAKMSVDASTRTGPPRSPAIEARMLPGNRLLVKLRRDRVARRLHRARTRVMWDYEAPRQPAPTPSEDDAAPEDEPVVPSVGRFTAAGVAPAAPARTVEPVSYEEAERTAPIPPPSEAASPSAAPPAPTVRTDSRLVPFDQAPETVRIESPGRYAIDVKRLLEEAPIVVQKDGSYLIHLPSLFDSAERRREKE